MRKIYSPSYILLFSVFLPITPLLLAAPPDQSHADEYASQLLDENNSQRHRAGSRLKAVNQKQRIPPEVERRLAAYVRQSPTNIETRAEHIGIVASVLATSHVTSIAIEDIIGSLTVCLDQQPLPIARRGCADALYLIARQTRLGPTTMHLVENQAFHDVDRKVRIGAMRTLIQSGPDEQVKRRLHDVLITQTSLDDKAFATPEDWSYETRADQNALLNLLWDLHEPEIPEPVLAHWGTKLTGGNLHDSAYRMLDKFVKQGPFPERIYDLVLAIAEQDSTAIDSGRRAKLYQLLQRSRLSSVAEAPVGKQPDLVDDIAVARTITFDADIGRRRTAAYRLLEFINTNQATSESLDLLAGVVESEPDHELRQLCLRILGYAAPRDYIDVLHRYFDSSQYDHLVLRVFLASYGREAWIRDFAKDTNRHPKLRAAAIYDYTRSGFEVPDEMISFLQDIASDDPEYSVRQSAGQSLQHLDAWVPMLTRLERVENQLQALFSIWLFTVGVFVVGVPIGVYFLASRWRRIRQHFSGFEIFGWLMVTVLLVPAIGFGALSLFIHNGPTPTTVDQFLKFLPTYVLIVYFGLSTMKIIRSGTKPGSDQQTTTTTFPRTHL